MERSYFDEHGHIVHEWVVDHAPTINDNWNRQKDPSRGFSADRLRQQVGSIDADVFHVWAKKVGYYNMDNEKRKAEIVKFLNDNPQWRVTEKLVNHGANDAHIIVR